MTAVAVLAWPGTAVVALVWAVGLALLVDGAVGVVAAVRERAPGRLTEALRGATCVVLGGLALA